MKYDLMKGHSEVLECPFFVGFLNKNTVLPNFPKMPIRQLADQQQQLRPGLVV